MVQIILHFYFHHIGCIQEIKITCDKRERDYIGNYAILRKELPFWNLENYIFNVDRWKNFRGIRGKVGGRNFCRE